MREQYATSCGPPFQLGDLVSRDGTDLHRVVREDEGFGDIRVECLRAPADGWIAVGETEDNLAGRYALVAAADAHPSDPEHWSRALGANYTGDECKNCGRQRVLHYTEVNRCICEKCNWDQLTNDYALDHERTG